MLNNENHTQSCKEVISFLSLDPKKLNLAYMYTDDPVLSVDR